MSKTIIITGSSDGIGAAGARQLAANGHNVVIVGRSPEKTRKVANALGVDHFLADFTSFANVRRLAADLDTAYPKIDVLVNNAGGVFGDRNRTVDGFEKTLQINHLAPFLLTNLLMNKLLASRASVIQTSSNGARLFGHLDVDDLNNDTNYAPHKAYGTTKLENILFTAEMHRRFHDRGLSAAAFHPGAIKTSFASDTTSFMRFVYGSSFGRLFLESAEKGARQMVWLAEGTPGRDWQSGAYYEKKKIATNVNPQSRDADLAQKLWDRSADLVDVTVP